MVRVVAAYQPGNQGSILGGVLISSWDWVCILCVLSCVVSGGVILLTIDSGRPALVLLCSILVQSLVPPTGV